MMNKHEQMVTLIKMRGLCATININILVQNITAPCYNNMKINHALALPPDTKLGIKIVKSFFFM